MSPQDTNTKQNSTSMTSMTSVSWAGNLGRIIGINAEYSRGVPEPAYFVKTLASHHAMVLTAEAYVNGITDQPTVALDPIIVEVQSDLGTKDGSLFIHRLNNNEECRRVNNNIRAYWDIAPIIVNAVPGRYHYQFRFSADSGESWLIAPKQVQHLVVAEDLKDVPVEALIESSVLFKVGEITPERIGWLGPATVRTNRDHPPQPLPAEVNLNYKNNLEPIFLEVALQVWVPSVSNRADLTPEEHTLVLKQLGLRIESPFFIGSGSEALGFAGKAGIHEHDDIARFYLSQYLETLKKSGVPPPSSGNYPLDVFAGEKHLGTIQLHWKYE
ncbi:MAG: hypothetical protein JW841_14850 [Deltaproteobacteria bacterium]|nr:hypothetical protein [Deltaproteobacteria bacterium]